jgi:hypothetical protein
MPKKAELKIIFLGIEYNSYIYALKIQIIVSQFGLVIYGKVRRSAKGCGAFFLSFLLGKRKKEPVIWFQ